jgi:L-iditol 2-dehydrogenase
MRAAFCTEPGQFELRDRPTPSPEPGEAVVRVRNCGICGSDLHWYHGGFPVPGVCPGHEISGEVAELGAKESAFHVGDRVAVEPLIVCGECAYCRTGDYQICKKFRVLGTMVDGGFAEFVRVPASALFRLPHGISWQLGAMAEPMAVCVHAVRLAGVHLGARVLILGAGTIGLLSAVAARAGGAGEVLITARHPQQRSAAENLGARVYAASTEGMGSLGAYARTRSTW